jgi:hypothetical protein
LATRIFQRSAAVTDGRRRFSGNAWVVERDIPGRPDTIEFIRCTSRAEAEAELGDETPENAPWMLREHARGRDWRL